MNNLIFNFKKQLPNNICNIFFKDLIMCKDILLGYLLTINIFLNLQE